MVRNRQNSFPASFCSKNFGIAPRINAAGRIEHAKKAVEILVEDDYEKAKNLAVSIEQIILKEES